MRKLSGERLSDEEKETKGRNTEIVDDGYRS
jgi:hypothetical protein